MFLSKLQQENPRLVEAMVTLHQSGRLLPDTYVVDLQQFRANARAILDSAQARGIRLYFMLKQLGRNPRLAQELVELGYAGAVVVDFREAQIMMRHNIPIGNVGHLVQIPDALVEQVVAYGPEVITVYSEEKVRRINEAAVKLGKVQKLLIRVTGENDHVYSGQTAGISLEELPDFLARIGSLSGIKVAGVTSFPCFLYSEQTGRVEPTPNLQTVLKAKDILQKNGVAPEVINTPSATCVSTLALMEQFGGNCGEPGHGLTGTTPLHAHSSQPEKSCCAYLSEVSHNFDGLGYCYGGGFYRRGHVAHALVGTDASRMRSMTVIPPTAESIDYHFGLEKPCTVGETVIMAFRFQIFVTRSDVALLDNLATGEPVIAGIYDSQGNEK